MSANPITQKLYRKQHGICIWCRECVSLEIATIEHIQPRSLGGRQGVGLSNLRMACAPCNYVRGNRIEPPDLEVVKRQGAGIVAALHKSREFNEQPQHRRALRRQPNRRKSNGPTRFALAQMIPVEIWEKLSHQYIGRGKTA